MVKFVLLHVVSFILLSLVPVYILSTSLPSALPNMLAHSSSPLFANRSSTSAAAAEPPSSPAAVKRLNLFTVYVYFCYTVALLHFGSFVQLSALFKTVLALIFAAVFALLGFFGVAANLTAAQAGSSSGAPVVGQYARAFSYYTTQFVKGFLSENVSVLVDVALLVLLIWLANRHLEGTQRLSFRNDKIAQLKITYAREQKELASWLIEVVLPAHVVSHVKEKIQYSRYTFITAFLFHRISLTHN